MDLDPTTTKYLIKAEVTANGVVEKPDVIGAIFGQTEGLLGDELDLRDLQKSGRIGRIEVTADSKGGKTEGEILLPSSLDKAETAILAAALESIDRIGPCQAEIEILEIDDVRQSKRAMVADRAKELLQRIGDEEKGSSSDLVSEVMEAVRVEELVSYGSERLPAGPNVSSSDSIIVVEGRNDVANLLKNGIKNAIATEGTSIPSTIKQLSKEKVVSAFVDGDRGGELLLKELIQVADVDFVARAPQSREVEEITYKQIMKALRNKLPAEQFIEEHGLGKEEKKGADQQAQQRQKQQEKEREERRKEKEREERRKEQERKQKQREREEQERKQKQREEEKRRKQEREKAEREKEDRQEPQRSDEEDEEAYEQEIEEPKPTPKRGAADLGDYKRRLEALSGDLEGVLIGESGKVVKGPMAVRDLADTLRKEGDGIQAVVFDGVITQRLLDIATEKGIETVVGMKMGNVTKKPGDVDVYTSDDL